MRAILRKTTLWGRCVVSDPKRKNKDALRVGHPRHLDSKKVTGSQFRGWACGSSHGQAMCREMLNIRDVSDSPRHTLPINLFLKSHCGFNPPAMNFFRNGAAGMAVMLTALSAGSQEKTSLHAWVQGNDPAMLESWVNQRISDEKLAVDKLLAVPGPRTVENTLRLYDDAQNQLSL